MLSSFEPYCLVLELPTEKKVFLNTQHLMLEIFKLRKFLLLYFNMTRTLIFIVHSLDFHHLLL